MKNTMKTLLVALVVTSPAFIVGAGSCQGGQCSIAASPKKAVAPKAVAARSVAPRAVAARAVVSRGNKRKAIARRTVSRFNSTATRAALRSVIARRATSLAARRAVVMGASRKSVSGRNSSARVVHRHAYRHVTSKRTAARSHARPYGNRGLPAVVPARQANPAGAAGNGQQNAGVKCGICQHNKQAAELYTLVCGHKFCQPCLNDLIKASVKSNNLGAMKCPADRCVNAFDADEIKNITNNDAAILADIEAIKAAYQRNLSAADRAQLDDQGKAIRADAQECPQCHTWYAFDGGCKNVTCGNCNHNFEWKK